MSLDYFESLTRHAVPLDERAIAALAHSAMALDVYCWLAQRLHRIPEGKPQFVPWAALFEQFRAELQGGAVLPAGLPHHPEAGLLCLPHCQLRYRQQRDDFGELAAARVQRLSLT